MPKSRNEEILTVIIGVAAVILCLIIEIEVASDIEKGLSLWNLPLGKFLVAMWIVLFTLGIGGIEGVRGINSISNKEEK